MNFSDFKDNPQDLVGRNVLYQYGSINGSTIKELNTIVSVNKKGFIIEKHLEKTFSFDDGQEKKKLTGLSFSKCTLISLQERDEYIRIWKEYKNSKVLRTKIIEKLESISFAKLKEIEAIIDSKD